MDEQNKKKNKIKSILEYSLFSNQYFDIDADIHRTIILSLYELNKKKEFNGLEIIIYLVTRIYVKNPLLIPFIKPEYVNDDIYKFLNNNDDIATARMYFSILFYCFNDVIFSNLSGEDIAVKFMFDFAKCIKNYYDYYIDYRKNYYANNDNLESLISVLMVIAGEFLLILSFKLEPKYSKELREMKEYCQNICDKIPILDQCEGIVNYGYRGANKPDLPKSYVVTTITKETLLNSKNNKTFNPRLIYEFFKTFKIPEDWSKPLDMNLTEEYLKNAKSGLESANNLEIFISSKLDNIKELRYKKIYIYYLIDYLTELSDNEYINNKKYYRTVVFALLNISKKYNDELLVHEYLLWLLYVKNPLLIPYLPSNEYTVLSKNKIIATSRIYFSLLFYKLDVVVLNKFTGAEIAFKFITYFAELPNVNKEIFDGKIIILQEFFESLSTKLKTKWDKTISPSFDEIINYYVHNLCGLPIDNCVDLIKIRDAIKYHNYIKLNRQDLSKSQTGGIGEENVEIVEEKAEVKDEEIENKLSYEKILVVIENIYKSYNFGLTSCNKRDVIVKRQYQISGSIQKVNKITKEINKELFDALGENVLQKKSCLKVFFDNMITFKPNIDQLKKIRAATLIILNLNDKYSELNILEYLIVFLYSLNRCLVPMNYSVVTQINISNTGVNITLKDAVIITSRIYFSILFYKLDDIIPPFNQTGTELAYRFIYDSRKCTNLSSEKIEIWDLILYEFFEALTTALQNKLEDKKYQYKMNNILDFYENKKELNNVFHLIKDIKNNVPDKFDKHNLKEFDIDYTNSVNN